MINNRKVYTDLICTIINGLVCTIVQKINEVNRCTLCGCYPSRGNAIGLFLIPTDKVNLCMHYIPKEGCRIYQQKCGGSNKRQKFNRPAIRMAVNPSVITEDIRCTVEMRTWLFTHTPFRIKCIKKERENGEKRCLQNRQIII